MLINFPTPYAFGFEDRNLDKEFPAAVMSLGIIHNHENWLLDIVVREPLTL